MNVSDSMKDISFYQALLKGNYAKGVAALLSIGDKTETREELLNSEPAMLVVYGSLLGPGTLLAQTILDYNLDPEGTGLNTYFKAGGLTQQSSLADTFGDQAAMNNIIADTTANRALIFSVNFARLLNNAAAMACAANNTAMMNQIRDTSALYTQMFANPTAMTQIANNQTALTVFLANTTTRAALLASTTAMDAIAANTAAITTIYDNTTYRNALVASAAAMTRIANNAAGLAFIRANSTYWGYTIANATAMTSISGVTAARTSTLSDAAARAALFANATGMGGFITVTATMTAIQGNSAYYTDLWNANNSMTALEANATASKSFFGTSAILVLIRGTQAHMTRLSGYATALRSVALSIYANQINSSTYNNAAFVDNVITTLRAQMAATGAPITQMAVPAQTASGTAGYGGTNPAYHQPDDGAWLTNQASVPATTNQGIYALKAATTLRYATTVTYDDTGLKVRDAGNNETVIVTPPAPAAAATINKVLFGRLVLPSHPYWSPAIAATAAATLASGNAFRANATY